MPSIERRTVLAGGLLLPLVGTSSFAVTEAQPPSGDQGLSLRPTVHDGSQHLSLAERMAHYRVPGAAIAILRDGHVASMQTFGTSVAGRSMPVGADTLFSVGSVSKIATAALCLKLVSSGILDLDRDVGRWLRRWRIPEGPAGDEGSVTLRMLLSHTAGFDVHGFADYPPGAALPTVIQTLNGETPALGKPVERIERAGTRARYSGGGYMIVQALIEDAVGEQLDEIAQRLLFGPLGMTRSRFDAAPAADTADIAHAHDAEGRPVALPRGWQSFAELAASGLWTSARDLARLIIALGESYRTSSGFLPQGLAADMMTCVSPGIHGLGPRLAGDGDARIFHHGGANDSYKAYIEGNLVSGDGLVIVTNGANGDVLGDEIRNGVSDAMGWPGDWSVTIGRVPLPAAAREYAGAYRRREGQALELAGYLDTGFSAEQLEVLQAGDDLKLTAGERRLDLVPVSTRSFVAPDTYIPADVLRFSFDGSADGSVRMMRVSGCGGTLIFDKV